MADVPKVCSLLWNVFRQSRAKLASAWSIDVLSPQDPTVFSEMYLGYLDKNYLVHDLLCLSRKISMQTALWNISCKSLNKISSAWPMDIQGLAVLSETYLVNPKWNYLLYGGPKSLSLLWHLSWKSRAKLCPAWPMGILSPQGPTIFSGTNLENIKITILCVTDVYLKSTRSSSIFWNNLVNLELNYLLRNRWTS